MRSAMAKVLIHSAFAIAGRISFYTFPQKRKLYFIDLQCYNGVSGLIFGQILGIYFEYPILFLKKIYK